MLHCLENKSNEEVDLEIEWIPIDDCKATRGMALFKQVKHTLLNLVQYRFKQTQKNKKFWFQL